MTNQTISDQPSTPKISLEGITELQQAGRYAEAVAIGGLLLERQPKNPEVAHLIGVVYYQGGDMSLAAHHFENAIKLAAQYAPGTYFAYFGDALHKLGQIESAEAAFRRAIEIQPDLAVAHSNLGAVLMATGREDDAIKSFRAAVDIDPVAVEPHQNLGVAWLKISEFEQAEQSLRQALEIDPNSIIALSALGMVLSGQKRYEEAEDSCRQALSLDPNNAIGHTYLGQVFLDQEKFTEAETCFGAALALDPNIVPNNPAEVTAEAPPEGT